MKTPTSAFIVFGALLVVILALSTAWSFSTREQLQPQESPAQIQKHPAPPPPSDRTFTDENAKCGELAEQEASNYFSSIGELKYAYNDDRKSCLLLNIRTTPEYDVVLVDTGLPDTIFNYHRTERVHPSYDGLNRYNKCPVGQTLEGIFWSRLPGPPELELGCGEELRHKVIDSLRAYGFDID